MFPVDLRIDDPRSWDATDPRIQNLRRGSGKAIESVEEKCQFTSIDVNALATK